MDRDVLINRSQIIVILIFTFLQLPGFELVSQNAPITTISSVYSCPGNIITIPVEVNGFTNISSISLRIEYNSTVMVFDSSITNGNTQLPNMIFGSKSVVGAFPLKKITISWTNIIPVTLPTGSTLISLAFHYLNGTTSLAFNNSSSGGGDCEYADQNGDPLIDIPTSTYYTNGQCSPGTNGGAVSGSTTINYNDNTGLLSLTGQIGEVIKWQKQYNGEGYFDIPGTNGQTTYSEFPVYTGTWDYKAVVQYGSCSQQNSVPATVIVLTPSGVPKSWQGIVSDDYKNPENWSPPGVPAIIDNVEIPAGKPHYPVVKFLNLSCHNLHIIQGASFQINPEIIFTATGTISVGGE
jgi:hypothetical protein